MQQVIPSLPTWAAPPVIIPPISVTGRFMKIGVSSDTMSQIDMSMIAYWTIRARIMQVPGVANIAIWGERIKMPQVQVDPKRMAEHNVTLDEVMETTSEAFDVGLLQFCQRQRDRHRRIHRERRTSVSTSGPVSAIKSAKELAQIPINEQKEGRWLAARA